MLAGCGRIGFAPGASTADSAGGGLVGDAADGAFDAPAGASGSDAQSASGIAWVQSAVGHLGSMGPSESFALQAATAGDAIAIMVACSGAQQPTGVTLTAPGWTFTPLSPVTIDMPAQIAGASFGAIAPDTAAATATVTWTAANCNRGKSELADEFAGVDPTGGTFTFDATGAASGTGNCITSVTPQNPGDAVWAACYAATALTAAGSGFTPGASDGIGDFAEYTFASTAGASSPVTFDNTDGFVVVALTLKPALP